MIAVNLQTSFPPRLRLRPFLLARRSAARRYHTGHVQGRWSFCHAADVVGRALCLA